MSTNRIQRPWKLWLQQLCAVWTQLSILAAIFTVAGLFGRYGCLLDLLGIFRVQYTIVLLPGVAIFLIARRWLIMCMCAVTLAINLFEIVPLYLSKAALRADNVQSKHIRVLQMNVNSKNRAFSRALGCIRKLNPDILSVEEVTDEWQKVLTQNLTDYPYRQIRARPDNFGIALFSKLSLSDATTAYIGSARVPSISATIAAGDCKIRWLSVHVLPPLDDEYFSYRNEELNGIVEFLAAEQKPVILVGDLNSPPWSFYFSKLCNSGRFVDSEIGFGVQPTWPTNTVVLRIPVDHLLTRGKLNVINRFVPPAIGSDHFPVCVDLQLSVPPE